MAALGIIRLTTRDYVISETFTLIQRLVASGEVRVSEHGYDELAEDGITASEILAAVGSGGGGLSGLPEGSLGSGARNYLLEKRSDHESEVAQMSTERTTLTRAQLIAAEVFGYSFHSYEDHLGIGNLRYEQLMPESAMVLERAVRESWPLARVAAELKDSEESAEELLNAYRQAIAVIDAENPAESFRNAVRFAVQNAVSEGLSSEAAIEQLVTQICYRAADLAYLLDMRGDPLSRYSRHLRRETGVEYCEGYFDEDDA